MRTPRLTSPLARALVPVIGGIAFFAVFFVGLWLVAGVINHRADEGSRIGNKVFEVGKVKSMAKAVAKGGPMLFPDLRSPDGIRSVVLDHVGDDPATGWRVFYAYPADRTADCLVTHTPNTHKFVDCENRTLTTDQLQAPENVRPIVENKKTLYLDLRGLIASATTTTLAS